MSIFILLYKGIYVDLFKTKEDADVGKARLSNNGYHCTILEKVILLNETT